MRYKQCICITVLILAFSATALAQYSGPTAPSGSGGTAPYSTSGKSYGHGAAIGAGIGAGVGAGVLFLTLHHRGKLVGCVAPDGTLVNAKNKKTYTLVNDSSGMSFQPGQRVEVRGKTKGSSFLVHKGKELGSCEPS